MAPGTHPPAADPSAPRAPGNVRDRSRRSRLLRRPRRRAGVNHLPSRVGQGTPCRPDPGEYGSPLAKRVYDLRHACVSTWLNAGVPPAQVAEWAGHSVAVLLKVYAKCIDGQDQIAKRRIEDALGDPGEEDAPQEPDDGR
jgi:integrase